MKKIMKHLMSGRQPTSHTMRCRDLSQIQEFLSQTTQLPLLSIMSPFVISLTFTKKTKDSLDYERKRVFLLFLVVYLSKLPSCGIGKSIAFVGLLKVVMLFVISIFR